MKKLIALLMALVMTMSFATVAWGADNHTFGTEAEFAALTLADGDTVTLTADIDAAAVIKIDKAITLDLNGHKITRDHTNDAATTLYITATGVTVKDSAATNGAGIVNTGAGMAIWVDTNAALTLTDVNVTGSNMGVLVKTGGNLTVGSGAVVSGTNTTNECGDGIRAYDATVTVNSGAKIAASTTGTGIESYGTTTVTMNGEITSGDYGVQVFGGNVAINGDVTANTAILLSNEDGNGGAYVNNGAVTVTGGHIDAATFVENVNIGNDASYVPSASVSGGTFATDVSAYVAAGYAQDSTGTIIKAGTSYQGLYAQDTNTLTQVDDVDLNVFAAKAVKYNKTTGYIDTMGNIEYVTVVDSFGNVWPATYKFVNTLGEANVVLYKDAAYKQAKYYLAVVEDPFYVEATLFTDFGEKCGQVDYDEDDGYNKALKYFTVKGDFGFDVYEEAKAGACDGYVMYNNKLVPVVALGVNKVAHTAVYETKNGVVQSIECGKCGLKAVKAANVLSLPKGADVVAGETVWYWPATSAGTTGGTVQSAETFDAGIAMYVGMSVMAAAGSAVVLKKRER